MKYDILKWLLKKGLITQTTFDRKVEIYLRKRK